MPARGGKPAQQRFAAFLFVEMEALRIVFRGESLDRFGGEHVAADLAALADFKLFVEKHRYRSATLLRLTMIGDVISHSATPAALRAVHLKVTMPVSGRLAASSSRCMGCGSNSPAKARISSRVTRRGP